MTDLTLNDGRAMPRLGLGVYQVPEGQTAAIVRKGIDTGFRLVDTAAFYQNELGVGDGAKGTDAWITTKLAPGRHDAGEVAKALDESLALLGRDSVDLYLIHWPVPREGKFIEAWRALIDAREAGKAISIGVCNFLPEHLDAIIEATGVTPAVNQIELHPAFQQRDVQAYDRDHGIVTQSWSPLGQGGGLKDERMVAIAQAHGRSAAQIVIAWHLAKGLSVIPKASGAEHLTDNFAAQDVMLSDEDIAAIDAMDDAGGRLGPDPREL
ncbi:aldo/keto reductase [uncultured Sphingomonas sp.]|uniref:aldo/keto reductase n=1 Tax=uncultured Sphingomonas sp. TaxID=158754 RepID=UPI0035CC43B2